MFRLARHVDPNLTVGDCLYKRWTLVLDCDGCGRRADRIASKTLAALPAGATIGEVAARVKCAGCAAREGVLATMNWRSGD